MRRRKPEPVPEVLPSAIPLLREMEVQYRGADVYIPREKWDHLEAVLGPCSEGEYPHLIKCEVCPYSEECHATQDVLSGKAKKGKNVKVNKAKGK